MPAFNYTVGAGSPFYGVNGGTACVPCFGRLDHDTDLDMILGQSSGVVWYREPA